jgi:hypothetical protein
MVVIATSTLVAGILAEAACMPSSAALSMR